MSNNSNTSLFDRAFSRTRSFFSFSVEDEINEFEQEIATQEESNDHMIIDMSEDNSTTATPLNDNNVSSARNILADYYATLLNGNPAFTATATLAAAASPQ